MMKKILIIEDEANLSNFIRLELEYEKYEVFVSFNGRDGVKQRHWRKILILFYWT